MSAGFRQTVIAWAAALMLAVMGAVSAHHMGPPSEDAFAVAELRALGVTADDLCGPVDAGHAWHCPFCHKLPEAPRLAAPDAVQRLARVMPETRGSDLLHGPQHIFSHHSTRGPPRLS
ncbi:hypothetical protein [Vannielia litorea]|uniref:Uncharacterized protein n=1 Tax=Vannielia litorea TaxID=1217970 RepID=A0A1N6HQK4_9RHOB|nr:hypothetical protein [Vannielia litorea]SIO22010.1 hypothetical protein SAMN05444002_3595 [Vannielia litorea]